MVALAFLVAGCNGGGDDSNPTSASVIGPTTSTTSPFDRKNEMIDRDVQIDIAGAREIHLHRRLTVQFLTVRGPIERTNLTTIAITSPIDLGNGDLLLVDIGLRGGDALKSTVTVEPGYGTAPPNAPKVPAPVVKAGQTPSQLEFTVVTGKPPTELRFGYHVKPCTITLHSTAVVGSATCGAVYANTGQPATFKMTWNA